MTYIGILLYWLGFNSLPNSTYIDVEYYEEVFKDVIKNAWNNTLSSNDLKIMSFQRAINCFYDSDAQSIADRRAILYAYLKQIYSTADTSTLNRYKKILPAYSNVKRAVKLLCKLYDTEPVRTFSEDENINQLFNNLYEKNAVNTHLKTAYEKAKLSGYVGILPFFNEGKLYIKLYTRDSFIYKKLLGKVIEVSYLEYNSQFNEFGIRTWTPEQTSFVSKNNTKIEVNKYGIIPFVVYEFEQTMYQTVEHQLRINKYQFQSEQDIDFNINPFKYSINIPAKEFTNAIDEVMVITDVKDDGFNAMPSMNIVPTAPNYNALQEYIDNETVFMLTSLGIPLSLVRTDGTQPSGISRLLEMTELYEKKYEDEGYIKSKETEFVQMLAVIINIDYQTINVSNVNFSVSFPNEPIVIEPKDEYEMDKMLVNDNQMDVLDFVKKHGNINQNKTIEEIKAIIDERKKNKELLALFNATEMITDNEIINEEINVNNIQ